MGDGMVLLWFENMDWVVLKGAESVREGYDGKTSNIDTYQFTHFAYIDYPNSMPSTHPFYEMIVGGSGSEQDHETLVRTIGPRADSYADFCKDDSLRYYLGKTDSHLIWMPDNYYRLIFRTKEDRLCAEIALAQWRVNNL